MLRAHARVLFCQLKTNQEIEKNYFTPTKQEGERERGREDVENIPLLRRRRTTDRIINDEQGEVGGFPVRPSCGGGGGGEAPPLRASVAQRIRLGGGGRGQGASVLD